VLGAAALIFALGISGLEVYWRAQGVAPSVIDSKDLWSYVRDDVYGPDRVTLIGGSRVLFDVVAEPFSHLDPPLEVRHLGIGATHGVAVLRDLAADPDFAGLVIASVRAEGLEPARWDSQQGYVEHYHREWRLEKQVSQRLRTALARNLAVLGPGVSLRRLLEQRIETGRLPPFWLVFRADRSIAADYEQRSVSPATVATMVRKHYGASTITPPDAWLEATEPVEGWIRVIQSRGGRVAFVRFPTSGAYWRYDERFYPRARYWNRFADRSSALTLHFRDVPALHAFELPDLSHLNHWDAPAFTQALIEALDRRHFFERRR